MRRNKLNTKRLNYRSRIEYQPLEPRNLLAAITVNTLTDNGNGADGLISLREAIVATNTNAAFGDAPAGDVNGDSINFASGLIGQTVELSLGELEITDDLVIRGFGSTVQAAAGERIFSINTSEAVALSRLTLENGEAIEGGAIRFEGGGTLRIFQSQLFHNSASLGGAIYADGGNLSFFESTLSDNTALGNTDQLSNGGALYLTDGAATVVTLRTAFERNEAEFGNGGAIYAGESDQIFAFGGTSFTDNRTSSPPTTTFGGNGGGGGAIFSEGLIRVGQSTFTGNAVDDGSGGAIFASGRRLTVANTLFEGNTSDINGGAIYIDGGIIAQFNNARFSQNETFLPPNRFDISRGGAIHVARTGNGQLESRLTIRSGIFQGNESVAGGAIANFGDSGFISDSFFGGNVARGSNISSQPQSNGGGAIYNIGNSSNTGTERLQIFSSTFQNNSNLDNDESNGGAVRSSGSELDVAFSTFTRNRSETEGGAISFDSGSGNLTVFESDFVENRAESVGGAIFANSVHEVSISTGAVVRLFPVELRITGGSFVDNIGASSGGALGLVIGDPFFTSTNGDLEVVISGNANGATQFIGNRSLIGDGGGIFNDGGVVTIRDAVFSENAGRNGAGIFIEDGELTLIESQIIENDARVRGGAVFVGSGATFVSDSSFIDSNSSTIGGDVFEA